MEKLPKPGMRAAFMARSSQHKDRWVEILAMTIDLKEHYWIPLEGRLPAWHNDPPRAWVWERVHTRQACRIRFTDDSDEIRRRHNEQRDRTGYASDSDSDYDSEGREVFYLPSDP